MALKLYIAAVTIVATVLAAMTAATVHVTPQPHVAVLLLLAGLLCLTEFLQVRQYHYRGHGASHNLIEGVLAPIIYACSGLEAMLICLSGMLLAETIRRAGFLKSLFNVAQWMTAAACGALLLHAVAPAGSPPARSIAAVALAIGTMSLVNHVLVGIVLNLAVREAHESQSRSDILSGIAGRLVTNGASLVVGLTLVAAYRWSPWLIVVGGAFVLGLDAAGRAHADVRADHQRLQGLQRATHALATSIDAAHALPTFLAEVRIGFEVQEVELVLLGGSAATVHRCAAAPGGYSVGEEANELAELLLIGDLREPTHLSTSDGLSAEVCFALARSNHSRALAVPLRAGDRAIGMLLLYDRIGVEGFESGELTVAAALARELLGFFERVDLMGAIDEERRKLADIVESTSDGILTVDADGIVMSWNQGLTRITGYSAAEMVQTRHLGLLRARDSAGRDVLIERWQLGSAETGNLPPEVQIITAAGQTVWLSCSYSRIPAAEGHREILVVVARNITQARELERLKDDFVAVVSHELRTPLVPIKGWAQTLINRGDRLTDDQRRTAVQSILSQAQKLESLVLNILEASRIESGRMDGDGIADVAAVTLRIVEDTLSARPDRTVRVRPPAVPCQVRGSAVWVERAVSNLVANAVKYSPDDEPVDVSVSVQDDFVHVAVTDRGPGIATDAQDRIFERFERLEETRTQTGTGLGLYITRRLARAMGGDVSVSSVPGAGSTFLLRMPLAPLPRLPEQRSDAAGDANVVNLR